MQTQMRTQTHTETLLNHMEIIQNDIDTDADADADTDCRHRHTHNVPDVLQMSPRCAPLKHY